MSEAKERLRIVVMDQRVGDYRDAERTADAIEALIDERIAAREQCEYAPEGHGRCGLAAGHDGMHVQEWAKAEPTAGGQRRDLEALGYERHVYDHANMGQHIIERCCEPQPSAEAKGAKPPGAAKTEPPAVVHVETINPQLYLEKGLLRDPDRYVPSPDGALIIAWRTGERELVECELDVKQLQEALAQLPEVMAGELNATAPASELQKRYDKLQREFDRLNGLWDRISRTHELRVEKLQHDLLAAREAARATAPAEGGRSDTERFDWFFGPANKIEAMGEYFVGVQNKWSLGEWRAFCDRWMNAARAAEGNNDGE